LTAVNGWDKKVLERWERYTGIRIDPDIYKNNPKDPDGPHVPGCYLSHYYLLQSIWYRNPINRPDLLFVFEDDATCVPSLRQRVKELVQRLPSDWDILFVGGKPFSDFPSLGKFPDSTQWTLRRDICQGAFGVANGPLAPDGTRHLAEEQQPYWQTLYHLNTEAYVINSRRIDSIMELLHPKLGGNVPYDVRIANCLTEGTLKGYMSTMKWCRQEEPMTEPLPWNGYFGFQGLDTFERNASEAHPGLVDLNYIFAWQDELMLANCSY